MVFLISEAKKRAVVSFEGTHDPKQLFNEITQFDGVPYTIHSVSNDVKVMKYFYQTYTTTLMEPVRTNLASMGEGFGKYQLIFTGHSLGGALA